jgi:branched-chain amino acid transport system substrate-binding protein
LLKGTGVIGIAGLTGCLGDGDDGSDGGGGDTADNEDKEDGSSTDGNSGPTEPFNITFFTSLSGTFGAAGKDSEAALEILEDKHSEIQGRDVQIEVVDTQTDPEETIQQAQSKVDDSDLFASQASGGTVTALQDFATDNEIPYIITATSGQGPSKNCSRYTYQAGPNHRMKSRALAPWGVNELGEDVFLITYDYSFGYTMEDIYGKKIEESGGSLVGTQFVGFQNVEWSDVLLNAEDSGADWILSGLAVNPSLMTQANQYGLHIPQVYQFFFDLGLRGITEDAYDNIPMYVHRSWVSNIDTEKNNELKKAFEAKREKALQAVPAEVYRHMDAFLQSAKEADGGDIDSLMANYEGFRGQSITGDYLMRECDHQGMYPTHVAEAEGLDASENPKFTIQSTLQLEDSLPECSETDCQL